MRIVLALQSPRRRELLKLIVPAFETAVADVSETTGERVPTRMVEALAQKKALAIPAQDALVIGADTMVFLDGRPFGKPGSPKEARAMLRQLSGRAHTVCTGVCVYNASTGRSALAHACTDVYIAPLDAADIDAYVATGDPLDKAGAYGIQGYFSRFVEQIHGCYFNVVGLPVRTTYLLLKEQGWRQREEF